MPADQDIEIIISTFSSCSKSSKNKEKTKELTHKGISQRAFTRSFCLADDVVVNGAELVNGMLTIQLEKIVPEEKKPKTIKIK